MTKHLLRREKKKKKNTNRKDKNEESNLNYKFSPKLLGLCSFGPSTLEKF